MMTMRALSTSTALRIWWVSCPGGTSAGSICLTTMRPAFSWAGRSMPSDFERASIVAMLSSKA